MTEEEEEMYNTCTCTHQHIMDSDGTRETASKPASQPAGQARVRTTARFGVGVSEVRRRDAISEPST